MDNVNFIADTYFNTAFFELLSALGEPIHLFSHNGQAQRVAGFRQVRPLESAEGIAGQKGGRLVCLGACSQELFAEIETQLGQGDYIFDVNNYDAEQVAARAAEAAKRGLAYLEIGHYASPCAHFLTIGGDYDAFVATSSIWSTLVGDFNYMHCGAPGSGQFYRGLAAQLDNQITGAFASVLKQAEQAPKTAEVTGCDFVMLLSKAFYNLPCEFSNSYLSSMRD